MRTIMSYEPNKLPPSSPRELIVVARHEAQLRVTDGVATAQANYDVRLLNALLRNPKIRLRPLFQPDQKVPKHGDDHCHTNDHVAPPDLSVYFRLFAPDEELDSLARQLRELTVIDTAYVKPGVVPPRLDTGAFFDGAPREQSMSGLASQSSINLTQEYLDCPPGGLGARSVWCKYRNGDGTGVNIIDIEQGWRFSHRDLQMNQGGLVGGTLNRDDGWVKHGTAVLGIIGGDRDYFGITGICPGANVRTVSDINMGITDGWGTATAIQYAANMLNPGDIILLELQRAGPSVKFLNNLQELGYIPEEWWEDGLMAIQYATNKGVLVVEAGGNGRENLDDAIYDNDPSVTGVQFRNTWHNPFRRDLVDSGAIIVGAGAPPPGTHGLTSRADCSRLSISNFGSMFDAQGWGSNVETCGGAGEVHLGADDNDQDQWYTQFFSGTSSAAAMVAGALGCIQGARKGVGLAPLTPRQARDLLRREDLGTPQPDASRIGSRPNLLKMIAAVVA
jgi:Subtilase family